MMSNPIDVLFGNTFTARKAAERFKQLVVAILGEDSDHINTSGMVQAFITAVYVGLATDFGNREGTKHFTQVFLQISRICENGTQVNEACLSYIKNRFMDESSWQRQSDEWWKNHTKVSILLLQETMVESFNDSHRRILKSLRLPQAHIIGEDESRPQAEDASRFAVI